MDRINKTEKVSNYADDVYRFCVLPRRKDNEIEFALYHHGFAYPAGLSDRICARPASPVFKIKGKNRSGEFIGHLSHTGQMTNMENYKHVKEN